MCGECWHVSSSGLQEDINAHAGQGCSAGADPRGAMAAKGSANAWQLHEPHAECARELYVELPPELGKPGLCGRLRRCLYGTRDAPARWEALYTDRLEGIGFRRGAASASCFWHAGRRLRCTVRGDDFMFQGARRHLDWARGRMEEVFLFM